LRAGTCAGETPEQAAVRKHKDRADRRAKIDDLKGKLAGQPDSAQRRAIEQQIKDTLDQHAADVEGVLPGTLTTAKLGEPQGMQPAQRDRLLTKMADYDMRNAAHARAWAVAKRQELGR